MVNFLIALIFSALLTACSGSSDVGSYDNSGTSTSGSIIRPISTDNQIPIAIADRVITDTRDSISIGVLDNDFGLSNEPLTLKISSLPEFGNIAVTSDNSVIFLPTANYTGLDSFTYQVTDANGDSATALVILDIRCFECTIQNLITLKWNPTPDNINGYIVNVGSTEEEAGRKFVSVPNISSSSFNPQSPSIQIDPSNLGIYEGEKICFKIKAFKNSTESASSDAICTIL